MILSHTIFENTNGMIKKGEQKSDSRRVKRIHWQI